MNTSTVKIATNGLDLYYGTNHALKNISMELYTNKITAFIGPSGCGKSTFLKTLNRMNDLVPNVKIEGEVLLDNENIYDQRVDTTLLRKKVGMVFQQPNPCLLYTSTYNPHLNLCIFRVRLIDNSPQNYRRNNTKQCYNHQDHRFLTHQKSPFIFSFVYRLVCILLPISSYIFLLIFFFFCFFSYVFF